MASLLATWLVRGNLPYPADKLVPKIIGRGILSGGGDEGLVAHAWALGPAALMINTLTFLPLVLAVVFVCRRSAPVMRVWDLAVLAAGALTLIAGTGSGLLLTAGILSSEYRSDLLVNYALNFGSVPAFLSGLLSVLTSYRLMRRAQQGVS